MNHATPRRLRIVGLVLMAASMLVGFGARAAAAPGSGPTLTIDSSHTHATGTAMVSGAGFTPGGAVAIVEYVAINDQSGLLLFESRKLSASLALNEKQGADATPEPPVVGGEFDETFGSLCGSTVMLHAYDQSTSTWSNWLTLSADC